MRRIVIDMQNTLFADAIEQALMSFDSDFEPHCADGSENTLSLCSIVHPYALLMEVTGAPNCRVEERLKICNELKACEPDCKVVFVVDENTEKKLADRVRQVKKDGLIDQFIYGSISSTYLAAVIDSL